MKQKMLTICIIITFLTTIMPVTFSEIEETKNQTIYVDDDNTMGPWEGTQEHPYQYVQEGIDHATEGDVVFICTGYYHEINLTCNNSIILLGEEKENTIIEGKYNNTEDSIFLINITNMTISNLLFKNYTIFYGYPFIQVNIPGNFFFINNILKDTGFGLAIYSFSKDLEIEITGNEFQGEEDAFFGLLIYSICNKVNLSYNVINGFSMGIYAFGDISIYWNHISQSDSYGLVAIPNSLDEMKLSITHNNFIENKIHATFTNGIDFNDGNTNLSCFPQQMKNFFNQFRSHFLMDRLNVKLNSIKWKNNFWDNKKLIGPKCILGTYYRFSNNLSILRVFPWINIDWHPAKDPYKINR